MRVTGRNAADLEGTGIFGRRRRWRGNSVMGFWTRT